ncbi:probable NADH dehydrogenase [ubiquinone] 1 alpha subcomplex subunit 12 [Symsagittifera roscoffensis]|uniref:probable NADH dehydrogenase [ubiquinone] 1 alpha subcomplex subunit 12 n=1 Tax=Symsagittifera roscoffensis TaxID=84072 RepID=UPI00307C22F8
MAEGKNLVSKFFNVIKHNGGVTGTFLKYCRGIEPKQGTLMGEDQFGNKYFENKNYFMARNRWVEFNPKPSDPAYGYFHFDASQIPPDWHRWMHHMTDQAPSEHPLPKQKFHMPHQPNYSGLNRSYTPFSTTTKKIHEWDPTTATSGSETNK